MIVGLGNPGKQYDNTRHNVGFRVMDALEKSMGMSIKKAKFSALTATGTLGGKSVMLMKPQTFMNLSGRSVAEAAHFYKVPVEKILVIFDDISLDVGRLRLRKDGSPGGHNGIKSIIGMMQSPNFPRVKVGVGAKPHP
ncbi:MAG: aminoacyl-tRNA hydrolase, partial [Eubacteriales bacterium]